MMLTKNIFGLISSSTGFEVSSLTANDLIYGFLAFLFSVLLSFALTPVIRVLAFKIGAVDVPKDARRMHTKPIPLIGGLGIFISFCLSTLLFIQNISLQVIGMLCGMLFMVILGVIDDIHDLSPMVKLGFQIIAALIPVISGVTIDSFIFAGRVVVLPSWLSLLVTVLWIVGITNAVNLIDGLDGLACGVSVIAASCLLLTAIISSSETYIALLALLLSGSCLGFLPFNIHPAKIFMGDTGALMLGYSLSIISVLGVFKFNALVSFLVPFLILGLPFGDTMTAIIRRLRHHKSPFQADRGHLHHKLIDMGFSQRASVLILYAISALLGICAVMFIGDNIKVAIYVLLIGIVVAVIDVKVFLGGKTNREQTGVIEDVNKLDEVIAEEKEKEEKEKEEKEEKHSSHS